MGMSQSVEQPAIEPTETIEEPEPEPEEEDETNQDFGHGSFDWYLSWI
jgi:hypothetical protein